MSFKLSEYPLSLTGIQYFSNTNKDIQIKVCSNARNKSDKQGMACTKAGENTLRPHHELIWLHIHKLFKRMPIFYICKEIRSSLDFFSMPPVTDVKCTCEYQIHVHAYVFLHVYHKYSLRKISLFVFIIIQNVFFVQSKFRELWSPARQQIWPWSRSKVKVTTWYHWKGLVTKNTHAKYQSSTCNTAKVLAKVKVKDGREYAFASGGQKWEDFTKIQPRWKRDHTKT